jgi:hypothetical protein
VLRIKVLRFHLFSLPYAEFIDAETLEPNIFLFFGGKGERLKRFGDFIDLPPSLC